MSHRQIDMCLKHFYTHKITDIVVYQFGVLRGNSIKYLLDREGHFGIRCNRIYGFDSFVGLPKEADDIPVFSDFGPGAFDLRQQFGLQQPKQIAAKITNEINDNRVTLISGFFSDLKDKYVKKYGLLPADLVYLDADLYISTIQALRFLYYNRLLKNGCLLAYDEFTVPGINDNHGEQKAHFEFLEESNIKCHVSYEGSTGTTQKTFVIENCPEPPKQPTILNRLINKLKSYKIL
jgi:hypothetical protein